MMRLDWKNFMQTFRMERGLIWIYAMLCFAFIPILGFAQQLIKIMPLGDSITHGQLGSSPIGGYRDDLVQMLLDEGINFNLVGTLNDGTARYPYHEGHPGWMTREIAQYVQSYLRSTHPEIVLIHIGTNDINSGQTSSYVQWRTNTLLDSIFKFDPTLTVIVASIIPRKGDLNREHTNLAPLIRSLVNNRRTAGYSVFYAPVNELFLLNTAWENLLFDTLHPNNDGYNVISRGFYKLLMDVITAEGQIITDNFNRRDLVSFWTSDGNYEIQNHEFKNADANSAGQIAVYRFDYNPKAVTFTFGNNRIQGGDGATGVALKLSTGTSKANGYAIIKESPSNDLVLYHVSSGKPDFEIDRETGLKNSPKTGDTLMVTLFSDASGHFFDCFLNGSFEARLTDSGKREGNGTQSYAGVLLKGTQNNQLDNFAYFFDEFQPYNGPTRLLIVQGGHQEGTVNHLAAGELVVQVLGINQQPVAGIPVNFTIRQGTGTLLMTGSNGLIGIEAESGLLTAPMQVDSAVDVAAKKYLTTPITANPNSGQVELDVEILQTGNYNIWGRVKGPDATRNSFYMVIDQNPAFVWQVPADNLWHWDVVGENGGADPKPIYLTAGRHVLTIRTRESGVSIDRLIFSLNSQFTPENTLIGSSLFYTDANGQARARFIFPKNVAQTQVEAATPDYPNLTTNFTFQAKADVPALLTKIVGDHQLGKPGETLPDPLQVKVSDQFQNPITNVAVQFTVQAGNGVMVEPQPVQTNSQGLAESHWTLGQQIIENSVRVTCPNYSLTAVIFTAMPQQVAFSVAGRIQYYAASANVPDVSLTVTGGASGSTTTDANGGYTLKSLPKAANFVVTPQKSLHTTSARQIVDLYNAVLIMRYILGLESLTEYQSKAADVDQNQVVESYDAANIARFVVELPALSEKIKVGGWSFLPVNRSYTNLNADYQNQNFTGVMLGDLMGRWPNAYENLPREVFAQYNWTAPLPRLVGDTLMVPFNAPRTEILSCDLFYQLDASQVALLEIQKTKVSKNFSIFHNLVNNRLQLAMFSPYPTTETGTLVNLYFRVLQPNLSENAVLLEKYRFNDEPFLNVISAVPVPATPPVTYEWKLLPSYPNPFSKAMGDQYATIVYQIATKERIQIGLYNMLGQQLRVLVDAEQPAGNYQVHWDGTDWQGQATAAGIYFIRLKTRATQIFKRLIKLD